MDQHVWTVSEAKAKLSELLRLAGEEGPQVIGTREPYVVITRSEWERLNAPRPHLGAWLRKNMPTIEGLELPSRHDRERDNPFDETIG